MRCHRRSTAAVIAVNVCVPLKKQHVADRDRDLRVGEACVTVVHQRVEDAADASLSTPPTKLRAP